ncbi:MAG: glutamate--tRNA ligase [archaeon]
MDLENDAYRYAIKNAYLHEGHADVGAVVGKMKALDKALDLKAAMPVISLAVKKVNAMDFGGIEKEFEKFEGSYELKPPEKPIGLPDFEWAKKDMVVTRFAPNPNGPFHLGNARAAILSFEYAKKYLGKFFLRFDDTDPKVKKPIANAKEIYIEDLNWLGCPPAEVFFASDRLSIYHDFMRKTISMGHAYVCECEPEKWRKLIGKKKACPCREKNSDSQMERFNKMIIHELKEGSAVLRIKTDLSHPDPSVRDWWAAKIVDKVEHPNPKVKDVHVWPSYNFASAIDDHELGVTLIIRGQEHEQNMTKQKFLYEYFGWAYPHSIHFGRIKLGKMVLSTSKIKEGIEKGIYSGWDDPRLGTIRALRRRGFAPQALVKAVLDLGIKPNDASIEFARLADLNRGELLKKAVPAELLTEPVELSVQFTPKMEAHGIGISAGSQSFFVEKSEINSVKIGSVFRLKKALNVNLLEKSGFFASGKFAGTHEPGSGERKKILRWVIESVDVEILMDDVKKMLGITKYNGDLNEGDVLYFEKFGYARAEEISPKRIKCVFAHK